MLGVEFEKCLMVNYFGISWTTSRQVCDKLLTVEVPLDAPIRIRSFKSTPKVSWELAKKPDFGA